MSEKDNTLLVQTLYDAFSRGDMTAMLDLMDEGIDWTLLGPAGIPYAGNYKGKEGVTQFFQDLSAGAEIHEFLPEEFITERNMVVVLGRENGIAKATGKKFETRWCHVFTLRDGKVERFREYTDTAAVSEAFAG
ncbi:MAG TPA: nuclear transport factor 2 family protein [bacterium]|nr:nuclear transport factor 2 family protein [bacterium]